jgi:hypothetical protein
MGMKKIITLSLLSTSIYASHSVDLGGFFTSHHEPGYSYDLGGVSLKYEIGNSKGLKAAGKISISNDSDLLFVQSNSEILYYLPLSSVEIFPFFGARSLTHEVYKEKGVIGTINRVWAPCGIGATSVFGSFSPQLRIAYLFPLAHTYIESGEGDLYGRKFVLTPMYWVEAKCEYKFTDGFAVAICADWEQDFHQKQRTITGEAYISLKF